MIKKNIVSFHKYEKKLACYLHQKKISNLVNCFIEEISSLLNDETLNECVKFTTIRSRFGYQKHLLKPLWSSTSLLQDYFNEYDKEVKKISYKSFESDKVYDGKQNIYVAPLNLGILKGELNIESTDEKNNYAQFSHRIHEFLTKFKKFANNKNETRIVDDINSIESNGSCIVIGILDELTKEAINPEVNKIIAIYFDKQINLKIDNDVHDYISICADALFRAIHDIKMRNQIHLQSNAIKDISCQ